VASTRQRLTSGGRGRGEQRVDRVVGERLDGHGAEGSERGAHLVEDTTPAEIRNRHLLLSSSPSDRDGR
jgi:hypothetical protein